MRVTRSSQSVWLPFVFCETFINRTLFRMKLPNLDNINNLDCYQTRCLKT